ncbi:protein of unknown function [Azospirillum lipoferum 4B]|uniref:Uncharacterized protein n=1 Tax=Azospirillum lipoferum (strain 4B) TaxID=862719 RepID=G7Z3R8_AZOL4|nr:protein of unknown function [Azospirillum lipoferum 4B]
MRGPSACRREHRRSGRNRQNKKASQMPFPATPADNQTTSLTLPEKGKMVEPRRIELPTYALRTRRSPS